MKVSAATHVFIFWIPERYWVPLTNRELWVLWPLGETPSGSSLVRSWWDLCSRWKSRLTSRLTRPVTASRQRKLRLHRSAGIPATWQTEGHWQSVCGFPKAPPPAVFGECGRFLPEGPSEGHPLPGCEDRAPGRSMCRNCFLSGPGQAGATGPQGDRPAGLPWKARVTHVAWGTGSGRCVESGHRCGEKSVPSDSQSVSLYRAVAGVQCRKTPIWAVAIIEKTKLGSYSPYWGLNVPLCIRYLCIWCFSGYMWVPSGVLPKSCFVLLKLYVSKNVPRDDPCPQARLDFVASVCDGGSPPSPNRSQKQDFQLRAETDPAQVGPSSAGLSLENFASVFRQRTLGFCCHSFSEKIWP